MLHRIQKIISAKPYTIVCEWTNGEIREIDLSHKLIEWAEPNESIYKNLLDKNVFTSVGLDPESKTLFWAGLLKMKDLQGKSLNADLDLDPEVLYENSSPVEEVVF